MFIRPIIDSPMIVGVACRGLRRVLDRAMAEFSGRHEVQIRATGQAMLFADDSEDGLQRMGIETNE